MTRRKLFRVAAAIPAASLIPPPCKSATVEEDAKWQALLELIKEYDDLDRLVPIRTPIPKPLKP